MSKYPVKKWCLTAILLFIVIVMGKYSFSKGRTKDKVEYPKELELVAATINGHELTLRNLAFYVAYEESEVERQAYIYNPDNTNIYWNLHANNTYIRKAARNAAIQMALHDELFYQMALEEGITLNEEEEAILQEKIEEYWSELVDYGKDEMLGVIKEDISHTLEKIAYAQKMQYIYAQTNGMDEGDYDFTSDIYLEHLEMQKYKIYEDVWGRVDFGNVTLTH